MTIGPYVCRHNYDDDNDDDELCRLLQRVDVHKFHARFAPSRAVVRYANLDFARANVLGDRADERSCVVEPRLDNVGLGDLDSCRRSFDKVLADDGDLGASGCAAVRWAYF